MRTTVVVLAFFIFSCGKSRNIPEGVLPARDMTNIFWDLMVADELSARRYPTDLSKRLDSGTAVYSQVMATHGATREQVQKSMRFYEGRPDLLQVIFDSLNKRASSPLPSKKDSIPSR